MTYTLNNAIGRLRILAILEGISYLLLGITMPLKYLYEMPQPNYIVGMAHGVLFMLYVLQVLQVRFLSKIDNVKTLIFLIASLIPFGTFYIDYKYLRDL